MRTADYKYNLRPDGGMPFRIQLPLGSGQWDFRPCADGQFGGVLKTYRDWKICGDGAWLRELWPAVKQSLEFAWNGANEDRWDPEMTGVLWGRQHHTLDMELFGPNSWLTACTWARSRPAPRWPTTWATRARPNTTGRCLPRARPGPTPTCSTASITSSGST